MATYGPCRRWPADPGRPRRSAELPAPAHANTIRARSQCRAEVTPRIHRSGVSRSSPDRNNGSDFGPDKKPGREFDRDVVVLRDRRQLTVPSGVASHFSRACGRAGPDRAGSFRPRAGAVPECHCWTATTGSCPVNWATLIRVKPAAIACTRPGRAPANAVAVACSRATGVSASRRAPDAGSRAGAGLVSKLLDQPARAGTRGSVRSAVDGSSRRVYRGGLVRGDGWVGEDGPDLAGVGDGGGQQESARAAVGQYAGGGVVSRATSRAGAGVGRRSVRRGCSGSAAG